jgi:hypothetical protein
MCEVKDKVFLYAVFMIISISMVTGCGCGESADSARIYVNYAEAEIEKHDMFIHDFSPECLNDYRK